MSVECKTYVECNRAMFAKRFGTFPATPTGRGFDNNVLLNWRNAANTADVGAIRVDSSDQVRVGSGTCAVKVFNRPTTDAFALQVKSEFTGTATGHNCLEVTADWKGNGAAGGGNVGVCGVSRVAATFTMGGGALIANYGQIQNLGTVDSGVAFLAAQYGLIEDGGTYTAVAHVAAGWFDSHLAQTVTAGQSELLYLTNNGATTLNSVFFIYPGNKISNLFTIDPVDTGLVSAKTAGAATITNWYAVKCNIHGETKYAIFGDIA